jgi:putative spermidine/putrescine transport system permease protein
VNNLKVKIKPYVLLAPVLFVILGIFMTGIIIGFAQSLGYFPVIGLRELTFKYYKEILNDAKFLTSLKFSLYISLVSSIIAVILGAALAYLMMQNKHKKGIEQVIYKLPIVVPHIVAALLVYNILSQSGIFPRLLYSFGLISSQQEFPALIFDKWGIGVITAYLWKEIPFIAMVVYTVLGNINDKLTQVALNLGASKGQIFWHVLLPIAMPSIISSFIIIFAFSFGAFEVPYLLGPTSPKPLAVQAYIEYSNPDLANRPYAMAVNSILTIISIALIWVYEKSFKILGGNLEEVR